MEDYQRKSEAVARAFVAAFEPYVRDAAQSHDVDVPGLDGAIDAGTDWLRDRFDEWSTARPGAQAGSPLELFREALRFPTAVLVEAGAEPAARDDAQEEALPGDVLDMAPATSQQLGEDAFRAHVAWGIARAEAVAGVVPATGRTGVRVVLVSTDLMDRTRIGDQVENTGAELEVWRNPGAVSAGLEAGPPPALALVDLTHAAASEVIGVLVAAGVRTVAFGPHVDDHALAAARALGAEDALPRSRFFRRLGELLPRVA